MASPVPWSALQVRHLASLVAVVESGSFREAARRLGYSQSAISGHVAALETIVGERLVTRPSSRVERTAATAAGELVLAEAEAILERLRAADQALRRGRSVRVGIPSGVAGFFLARALDDFAAVAPGVELEPVEALADADLFPLLNAGDLDLAFVVLPPERGPFMVAPLFGDELLLVCEPHHPLARAPRVALHDLDGERVLRLRRCRATDALLGGVDAAFRSDDPAMLVALLGRAAAVAVLPALHVPESDSLVVRAFEEHPYRRLGLAWHERRPPTGPALAFVDVCRALLVGERRLAPRREGAPAELRVSLAGAA